MPRTTVIPFVASEESKRLEITAPAQFLNEMMEAGEEFDPLADRQLKKSIMDRESDYQKRKYQRSLDVTEEVSYKTVMAERELEREELRVKRIIDEKAKEVPAGEETGDKTPPRSSTPPRRERKRRWDVDEPEAKKSRWDTAPVIERPTVNGVLLTDEVLLKLLPNGYAIVPPPEDYQPMAVSTIEATSGYSIPEASHVSTAMIKETLVTEVPGVKDLQFFKESDMKYFGKLLEDEEPDSDLTFDELKERKIMRLLLKVKNGAPALRKVALRTLTDNARQFGAKALFNQILPLLLEQSLEEQERHLLVKLLNRLIFRLDDLVKPYVSKILIVTNPLLIDEDKFARLEGREIISNLAKAAGLATMIATQRPDIDNVDEYVRNTTARSFAVVASALGVEKLIPFLKAVCRSKRSWMARHTGVKIVQQIAILVGCGILPHLKLLVECIGAGLVDENQTVRSITATALASLAEASAPYGVESFEAVLEPLWKGIKRHRGKALSAFLKCIGCIIPLMDPEYASHYTREVMFILLREFTSPDEEMKRTVLKVIQQCSATEGVTAKYLVDDVLPEFFRNYWVRRVALDKRTHWLVVETTVALSNKVGSKELITRILNVLKDESEPFRKMAVETTVRVITNLGSAGLTAETEERLIDGVLVAFQEQLVDDKVFLRGVGIVVNSLGIRAKPHTTAILSTILFRLKNRSPEVRQQAADLIALIAPVIKTCGEDEMLSKLSLILFESLGEVYPEVLGSILGAMKSIVAVVGLDVINPPINQLLPTLTPILRNRHEKVQENSIELVGRIADRGAEHVNAREWMRICFELLDMLKSTRKSIRRSANNTFGLIAKAIGPQDVLQTLLNNLRVQERQLRVCTAVAIGIVADTCAPFTVLPALMNEYRTPENNVQNGVLKAMTFMFEYIGPMTKDYVYAVTPLLEDALTDRDQVHRQTAASVVKHMALGCVGMGCEDAFVHFLNLLMPNIFETSPQVIDRVLEGIEGVRNAVGVGIIMNYIVAGLFHPARKVRTAYWKVYNSAYVQNAQSMIVYYPVVEEKGYDIPEMDLWI
ncbi:hypothetical protein BABINDRAFT_160974 [Babjeviella inositovora NRRL Y-12698]|uniref:Phosphatase PP2A regulatory subunit A/Splicing factor 3B subunit 1-like HEAT repeat domain-containing protein n=1 Tax=Babjeviella inositovora NRRL Y-12698 TaxID=984486 RepID=A0A1E3QSW4_9ASCO|nr:uncharacterized protein BABINDRAFT_160974 [Babjeviella inositovora NRRL Y-12698]ODQ80760.1 hypothetical protein BABINDRAFT_160974 [Babjeviella inositovora NRRL Y-12698]